ncbi:MAG TPA: hypothetical protein VFI78_05985 [Salinimicrobium sp.]|nr:hypothetical protein [Salinimicrobium sp.]
MYREIIIPTKKRQTIEFPEEFIGKQVEIIIFPIEEKETNLSKTEKAFKFWKKHRFDMSNFKFDRLEANER